MSTREVSKMGHLIKRELKDLRVYVSTLEKQSLMPSIKELDVAASMLAKCMEKIIEANNPNNELEKRSETIVTVGPETYIKESSSSESVLKQQPACSKSRTASKDVSHAVTSTSSQNSESNSSDKITSIVEKAVMGSAEEGERLHDVEPGQEPLRRSRRQSRQKGLPSEGSDSDDETPSGKNKKPRLSDNIKLEVVSSNSSAGVQAYWTTAMDARLTEGVAKHKEQSWARVAEFVGDGLTADQCQSRWNSYLGPLQRGLKRGNWQPDEEERLLELVPHHVIPSHLKAMAQERTDWKAIGNALGRVAQDCKNRYKNIQWRQMKKGPFTAEEDALICQRVEEWGDKGKGLWVALEKEMDRAGGIIRLRWHLTLSKRK